MPTNWKKLYAMKAQATKTLEKYEPRLENESGIYAFTRTDENGLRFVYVGQAKHLKDRLISHMLGYSQRIDISLKKRGWFDPTKNKFGWKLWVWYFKESELDSVEQQYIKEYANEGYQLYNLTGGSQGKGKVSINDGQSNKGYRDGLKQGRKNAVKEIKEYFDKYLDYGIKEPKLTKSGKVVAIKEKKYNEFKELLEGDL